LAVRGLVCLGPDVLTSDVWAALAAVRLLAELAGRVSAVAALDIQAVDPSAARSFVAQGLAGATVERAPQVFELA
jgi:hypothetical protein